MEFIEYMRAPSGEVWVADHPLADIFNVDDDPEPAGAFPVPRCIARVVVRLDDSEREAAERLADTEAMNGATSTA